MRIDIETPQAPASAAGEDDLVAVALAFPRHCIDLRLPLHQPVGAFLADLVDHCHSEMQRQGRDTEFLAPTGEAAHGICWHLELLGEQVIAEDMSLSDVGVREGDRIYLRRGEPTETYPALIDDVAEFVAYHQQQFPTWAPRHSRALTAAVLGVCSAFGLSGWLIFAAMNPDMPVEVRYSVCGALLVTAALIFALTAVCDRSDATEGTATVPRWGFWLGYATTAAGVATCVPRPMSLYTVIVTAVVLGTVAGLFYASTKRHPMIHVTTAAACVLALLAPLASQLYLWPPQVIAAQTMALGVIMLRYSDNIARALAKINLPHIAADGEPYLKNLKGDVSQLPLITSKDATLDSIFHQKDRVVAARSAIVAVVTGLSVPVAAGAFFLAATIPAGQYWLAAAYTALIAATLTFRGQVTPDALLQACYWLAATVTMLAYAAGTVTDTGLTPRPAIIVAALIAVAAVSVIVAIRQIELSSIPIRKMLDVIAMIMFWAPFAILGYYFMGLYHLFRAW